MQAFILAALVATSSLWLLEKAAEGDYDASRLEKAGVWALIFVLTLASL